MMNNKSVTCSFQMDRDIYNQYKSIISANGENVKGNIVRYMKNVIDLKMPNSETILAIQEVQEMKKNPDAYKSYDTVDELFEDILSDEI
ncbi:MAG: hypothetical protein CSB15_00255 [Clostridiales bacterium]|nr:MAG: hypothetical protein CSB15_00255 [Clostridiales bacterium]